MTKQQALSKAKDDVIECRAEHCLCVEKLQVKLSKAMRVIETAKTPCHCCMGDFGKHGGTCNFTMALAEFEGDA